uniref:Uncharacterized protein n=1 Tax=Myotis myotis TaxID=51298 RepID=A0A7J7WIA5_MYOMY|nr:hypothetical protein mMyoMyo1_012139 [Myotis myotis]
MRTKGDVCSLSAFLPSGWLACRCDSELPQTMQIRVALWKMQSSRKKELGPGTQRSSCYIRGGLSSLRLLHEREITFCLRCIMLTYLEYQWLDQPWANYGPRAGSGPFEMNKTKKKKRPYPFM